MHFMTANSEAWAYGDGGAQGLPSAGRPYVPHACGRIHGALYGVLRAGIRHATTPVPPLAFVTLWPRASPPDSLGSPTYCGLCDSM
jgi:hypothetical protein